MDGFWRPDAQSTGGRGIAAEPHAENGRLPHFAGPGGTRNRRGQPLPPATRDDGAIFPQCDERRTPIRSTSFPLPRYYYDNWSAGFNAAWELDFWGRFRRAVEAADAHLDAQVEGYDNVLVLLQAEVATNYIQMRSYEERLRTCPEEPRTSEGNAQDRDLAGTTRPGHGTGRSAGDHEPGANGVADSNPANRPAARRRTASAS